MNQSGLLMGLVADRHYVASICGTTRALKIMKRLPEIARFSLATIAALATGFLAQSALYFIVLGLTYPNTLRFFDDGAVLIYYVPTIFVMLAIGTPLLATRKVRARLRWSGGAVIGALLGALGASVPEMYTCVNPLIRCFLATTRDAFAGLGTILSGAACGVVVYFVYCRLAPMKNMRSANTETV